MGPGNRWAVPGGYRPESTLLGIPDDLVLLGSEWRSDHEYESYHYSADSTGAIQGKGASCF